ncbi:MAG: hypothetical protein K8F91_04035, partial [Candidatus Obscuribacterales bacterium]|nr:hypothetical protein [Candidatus Obscuribacterales bacterium]
ALKSDTCRAPGELGLQLYEHRRPGEDFSSAPHSVASVLSAGGISASYVCKCNHQEPHIIKDYWLDWLDEDAKWSLIGELSDICQTINQKIGIRPMVPNQWWPDADRFNVSMPSNRELSREISLREAVVGKAKLKPARIRKILLDLARQIEELHNLGGKYYHGALDPETIYLTKKLKVSIVEPPRIRSRLMELSKRILIPMHTYIAPEQFKKEPSRASDCYSLGKIAYFMLYGCDPESVVHIDHWAAFSGDLHVIDEIIRKTTTTDATQRPSIFQLVEWLAGQSLLLESEPLALGSLTDDL